MNIKPNILIFSVYQNQNTAQDTLAHETTKKSLGLNNISFKEIDGSYNGSKEKAFVVSAEHQDFVNSVCLENKQYSYLYSHNDRFTEEVITSNGTRRAIGTLKGYAQPKGDNYSFDPTTNTYWIAE